MEQQLMQALEASMNPQADLRKQAEQFINQKQKEQGYILALLNISSNSEINQQLALAAAVQLGTLVEFHWKFKDETHAQKIASKDFEYIILNEETDKVQLRSQIVAKLYLCTQPLIVKQYVRCIKAITKLDYPERWGSLMTNDIPQLLQKGEEQAIYTGLLALNALVGKFEYELEDDRVPLFQILESSFATLGNLINQLMQHTESEVALKILHLICKVFYTANQLVIAPFLADPNTQALTPWLNFFIQLMKLNVSTELCSFTEDMETIQERDKSIQWKIKGMASKITYRLFSKYGNPAYVKDEFKEFQKWFQQAFSEQLLDIHLQLMFARKANFVGSKCLNFNIKFVGYAVKIPKTFQKLQPFIENIMYETAIPIMLVSQRDQQLFAEDPIEYIRKQDDFTETLYMPKNTVIDLLQQICQHKSGNKKSKPDYLVPFLNYAVTNMNDYMKMKTSGQNPDWRIKEALLCAVGHLQDVIAMYKKELNAQIEPLLQTHVLPELSSEQPFLRSRACWVYGEFCSFKYTDEQHVKLAIDGVYKSLFVSDLPTKLAAAISLASMLVNKTVREFLKPALKQILEVYLKMTNEIDSEHLFTSLESFMKKFNDDMGPYALQIAQQLVVQYQRLVQVDIEDDDGEACMAAAGCVSAIRRLVESITKDADMLSKLIQVVFPIIMHSLSIDGIDAIEDGLDITAIAMYYGKSIAPDLWKMYAQMLYVVAGKEGDVDGGYGYEYLGPVVTCVQNFISKDSPTFLSHNQAESGSYLELTYKFVQQVLVNDKKNNAKLDGVSVLKVVVTMFENLQGQIDVALPNLVGMLLAELQYLTSKKKPNEQYKSMVLQTLALGFFNNATLMFKILEENQMTIPFFQTWLQFMPEFKKEFELRRVIFGLISILRCAPEAYPALVQQRLPDLFKTTADMVMRQFDERIKTLEENEKDIKEEQEEIAKKKANGENSDDMEDDGFEDEEDSDDMDDDEFEKTKKALAKMSGKGGMDDDDDDLDGDDSDDSDYSAAGGDMNLYDSKLDEMDEMLFMRETMQVLMQNQAVAQGMVGSYDVSAMLANLQRAEELKAREKAAIEASDEFAERHY